MDINHEQVLKRAERAITRANTVLPPAIASACELGLRTGWPWQKDALATEVFGLAEEVPIDTLIETIRATGELPTRIAEELQARYRITPRNRSTR
jgi:hypothetical protein